jgi:hypothetical protein
MRLRNSWLWSSCIIVAVFLPRFAIAQSEEVCNLSDSTAAYAAGLDDISHLFGSNTGTYPHEFSLASGFPAFNKVVR